MSKKGVQYIAQRGLPFRNQWGAIREISLDGYVKTLVPQCSADSLPKDGEIGKASVHSPTELLFSLQGDLLFLDGGSVIRKIQWKGCPCEASTLPRK